MLLTTHAADPFFFVEMTGWTGCSPCYTPRWCSEIFGLQNFAIAESRLRRNVTKECCRIKPRTSWRFCRSSWWFCPWPQGFSLETTACWITRCGCRIHAKVWERDSLIRAMQWLYCADSAADAQQRFHLSPWSADEEAGTVRGSITVLTCWDTDSSCQVKLYFFLFNANICKE